MSDNIIYREGFKYQLEEEYTIKTSVMPNEDIHTELIDLDSTGLLTLRNGFAWDGDTCAIDTLKSRRGSAIHDAFYRMMNLGLLSWKWKPAADFEYYRALITDGFNRVWANVRFKAVRKWGGSDGKTAHTLCSAPDKDAVHVDVSGGA